MKKIIYFVGILTLAIVTILNLIFTANMNSSEYIAINTNSIMYILGLILLGTLIFAITKIIDEKVYDDTSKNKSKVRKILFISLLIFYAIFNIVWIILVRPPIVADQIHTCNLAQAMYRGNPEEFLPNMTYAGIPLSGYIQAYSQQISLSFVYNIFFKIIHTDIIGLLRIPNIIGNILIVFALYKINTQLSKKYKTNKTLLLTLILTFISLPMLSTFIYGDIPSLALCLFSVYFMMRYTETKKIIYPIFAGIFTMIAYMMRMNCLIFIIATVIYLLLDLFKDFTKKTWKHNLINILVIVGYIVIAIMPTTLVKNYYINKYNLDKDKSIPTINYLLMATQEGPRANGWYSESIGEPAVRNPEGVKEEYLNRFKERLVYFSKNIGYTFNFYTMKIASMWTENTYSAVRNNTVDSYDFEDIISPLTFYQKVLLIITCLFSIIVLIKNRKNLSTDILFLITIFIGGFAFHILWEAKSRYIIPYIVVLIPVASISIYENSLKTGITTAYSKIKTFIVKG